MRSTKYLRDHTFRGQLYAEDLPIDVIVKRLVWGYPELVRRFHQDCLREITNERDWTKEEKRRNESAQIEERRRQGRSRMNVASLRKEQDDGNQGQKDYASKATQVNRTKPSKSTRIIMMRSFKVPRFYKARLVKATVSSIKSLSETTPGNFVTNVDEVKAGKSNKSYSWFPTGLLRWAYDKTPITSRNEARHDKNLYLLEKDHPHYVSNPFRGAVKGSPGQCSLL